MKPKSEFIIRWVNYTFGDVSLIMPTVYILALFIIAILIVWAGTTLWCNWRYKKKAEIYIRETNCEREEKIGELRRLHEEKIEMIKRLRRELIIWEKAGARLQVLMFEANRLIQNPTRATKDG